MSEFSRETLLNIIETDHVQCGEASALARMALAAMDSKPVGEVIERPCSGEMNIGMTYRLVKGIGEMESMPVGTKFYAAQPAPVVPKEVTAEQAYEIGDYHGDPVDVFVRGANWMRQHIIDSTLSAAPQEFKP